MTTEDRLDAIERKLDRLLERGATEDQVRLLSNRVESQMDLQFCSLKERMDLRFNYLRDHIRFHTDRAVYLLQHS